MLAAAAAALGLAHRPARIVGRDRELAALADVLAFALADGAAHGLFLSGNPGTGKTLCLRHACRTSPALQGALQIWINAATLARPEQVYQEIHRGLWPGSRRPAPARARRALEAHFRRPARHARPLLLVVDEVDHLRSRDDQILYFLFNTLLAAPCPLLLVSVANSLYFPYTDRVASRLSGTTRLEFAAYSQEAFAAILAGRVQELAARHSEAARLFENGAVLQLLAGRVMQRGGDIRTALQLAFRALARTVAEGLDVIPLRIADQVTAPDLGERALRSTELTRLEQGVLREAAREGCTTGGLLAAGYGTLGVQHPLDAGEPPGLCLIEQAVTRLCAAGLLSCEAGPAGDRLCANVAD